MKYIRDSTTQNQIIATVMVAIPTDALTSIRIFSKSVTVSPGNFYVRTSMLNSGKGYYCSEVLGFVDKAIPYI